LKNCPESTTSSSLRARLNGFLRRFFVFDKGLQFFFKISNTLLSPLNHTGDAMKYPAIIALAVAMMVSASAPALAETAQQSRMKDCNAQAAGKSGDDRKAFMKSCLSGNNAAPAAASAPEAAPALSKSGKPLTAQQMKMKDCSAQSKGMKGDERKKFMSSCLKK
jgi:hypothetical protein